jgi:hypothetical protein
MKRIIVKIGIKKSVRCVYVEDLAKLYYMKIRHTPRVPKYAE